MLSRMLGRLLRNVHAGERKLFWHDPAFAGVSAMISLLSPAFGDHRRIPTRYAGIGVGDNQSPALCWKNVPIAAEELVLIVEDADAPLPQPFVHLIASGIVPGSSGLAEGALSKAPAVVDLTLGRNSFGRCAYAGPRALPNHGPHRYAFQLFALGRKLNFAAAPDRKALLQALTGNVIARGRLDGVFERG